MRAITAGPSISTVARTPNSRPPRAPCAISAAPTRAFVGMHPTLIQVPPSASGSITATRAPRRRARIAQEMPPMPPPITTSSGAYFSSFVTLSSDELGRDARDRLVDQLSAAVLGVAPEDAFVVHAVLPDLHQRRRVAVDGDCGHALGVRDRVDVARRALARVARPQLERCRAGREAELTLDHAALGDGDADVRGVVVVEAGRLAGHPAEHPDVG